MRVTLKHEIEIAASPQAVYAFFENIEENYTKWHPDHIIFRWEHGDAMAEGAVAYTEQRMHGKLHRLPTRFTKVVPHHLVEFQWVSPLARFIAPRNVWIFEETDGGCKFTAECDVRVGWISSRLRHVQKGLAAGRLHLSEEGENLKRLVEMGQPRQLVGAAAPLAPIAPALALAADARMSARHLEIPAVNERVLPAEFIEGLRALERSYLRETDPIRASGFGGGQSVGGQNASLSLMEWQDLATSWTWVAQTDTCSLV